LKVNSKLGTNQVEWTKFKKQLFFDPKSPEIRTHLSIDSKKDFLVFTTKNLSNKKAKHVGNGINIYSDLFLITDTCIIYRGYFNKRSVKAAVKKYSQIDIDLYEDEVKLLLKLNKENPINFLKYLADISCNEGIYLATELPEQSLDIFMKNNSNKNIAENDLIQFIEHSCKGLNTLHNKNIVHSAVEPKNILISYPDDKGSRRVMLTNTGINNKNFNNNLESISWVSFEVIEALKKKETLRITEKGDIFSMGCVMYFVLSKGQYLFGSGIERFSDKSPVFETFDLNPTHIDLIKSMVNFNDSERPSIKEVLIHPTFWSSEKKLLFFTHIKNILFTKNFANMKTNNFEDIQKDVIKELEGKAQQIIGGNDWLKRLCPDVQKYEKNKNKHKISKTTEVKELINFIRNKDQHWDELKEEVLKKFGETPESYIDYFLGQNRFPSLLIHTYNAMKELKIERNLNNYYVVE
jgi:serine/threonine-protein kinase/endoribonuclease IRE1